MYFDYLDTELFGHLTLIGDQKGLHRIQFPQDRKAMLPSGGLTHAPELFTQVKAQLRAYFKGERKQFELALVPVGTPFQLKVWQALRSIPYGGLVSYKTIATAVGNPKAVRAVGGANGKNPLPIVVPCHRVIGGDGSLTGYSGGLWIKQRLIELEQSETSHREPTL